MLDRLQAVLRRRDISEAWRRFVADEGHALRTSGGGRSSLISVDCPATARRILVGEELAARRRAARVWVEIEALARGEGVSVSVRHAVLGCVRAVSAAGAGLSLSRGAEAGPSAEGGDVAARGDARRAGVGEPVFATDARSAQLEALQFTLGEGPALDAARSGALVLMADLAGAEARRWWPSFAPAAAELDVRGVVALPIGVGAARLGVLDLYRAREGSLSAQVLADALAFADAVLALAVDSYAEENAVVRGDGVAEMIDATFAAGRRVIHQATGMVASQLSVPVADALARLRAHAYARDRPLAEVAADVLGRRLRFHPGGEPQPVRPDEDGGDGHGSTSG